MVLPRRHLENFRVQGIYNPTLMRVLTAPGAPGGRVRFWANREEAEETVAWWRRNLLPAQNHELDAPTGLGFVSDPPPMQLRTGGRLYYLAFFNAHRAVYSLLPPPVELPGPSSGR
jgi:hypothetical protein